MRKIIKVSVTLVLPSLCVYEVEDNTRLEGNTKAG